MAEAAAFTEFAGVAQQSPAVLALVLGSGMGDVVRRLTPVRSLPFAQVPGLGASSVAGHRGRLSLGDWLGRRVLVFEGRLHFYEGHPWEQVVLPVRTAHQLGAHTILFTNAAGGIHDALEPGSLMAIRDHIEWTRPYCWRVPGPGPIGPARPSPYAPRLLDLLARAARAQQIELHQGIYAALT